VLLKYTVVRGLNNRQVIALPTPLTEPCHLEMVKLPHPLNLSSCEVCPSFSDPGRLGKEGNKGALHIMCPSSQEADVEVNCSSKDCRINGGNESLSRRDSIACSNEGHVIRDVEEKGGVNVLSVSSTDRVTGNERKGYYDTVQKAKAQATKPDEREVSSN
jgi:hypothetical protein